MVYTGKRKGEITCNPTVRELKDYCREMIFSDDFKLNVPEATLEFKHIDSGATFSHDRNRRNRIKMAPASTAH